MFEKYRTFTISCSFVTHGIGSQGKNMVSLIKIKDEVEMVTPTIPLKNVLLTPLKNLATEIWSLNFF